LKSLKPNQDLFEDKPPREHQNPLLGSLNPRPDKFKDRPPPFGTRQGQKSKDDGIAPSTNAQVRHPHCKKELDLKQI